MYAAKYSSTLDVNCVIVFQVYTDHPVQQSYGNRSAGSSPSPNTALLSTLLTFGTFGIAYTLRAARTSTYFTLGVIISHILFPNTGVKTVKTLLYRFDFDFHLCIYIHRSESSWGILQCPSPSRWWWGLTIVSWKGLPQKNWRCPMGWKIRSHGSS